jgi:hypothetical protein
MQKLEIQLRFLNHLEQGTHLVKGKGELQALGRGSQTKEPAISVGPGPWSLFVAQGNGFLELLKAGPLKGEQEVVELQLED